MRRPTFQICEDKGADQLLAVTVKLINAFVFATGIVQSLCFLNPKFAAYSPLLWLQGLVCVGPGKKFRLLVLSHSSYEYNMIFCLCITF